MATANQIRRTFLDHFTAQGHREVASSPLVPQNDPTLLFTNSGMVQFKQRFTGQETPSYRRAVTAQKCARAGGKHNDLDNVGMTARHHTFFEMLGNFSFGDYFKEEAILRAWQLITRDYGLDAKRLLVTVYHNDDEAADLWQRIAGLSEDKIIRIATSDNFWSMGDTGPCGPCSEIFYDHGPQVPGGPPGSPEEDGDRFIEIWNLVFMQYEVPSKGAEAQPLPKPSIDTGMGLERIAAILQGKRDNYDIDLMRGLIEASAEVSGRDPDGAHNTSHRIIADHLRSAAFLLAEGVLPSNEGRGYVLRRIMRRAMRHAHLLGAREPLMWRLVPKLVELMGGHYQELSRTQASIEDTLKREEARFQTTLERGLHLLDQEINKLGEGGVLPGAVAFKLYDTYGFPLDLTADILRGQGQGLDQQGFDAAMAEQKASARAAWKGTGERATDALWFTLQDQQLASEFLGYAQRQADAKVLALVKDGETVTSLEAGTQGLLLVNQTPFYAESGGQQGDRGVLEGEAGLYAEISDTQKQLDSLWVHQVKVIKGRLELGQDVHLSVDGARREGLRRHHSATHLLHKALQRQLGAHVMQKGSLVAPNRLRFDFSHGDRIEATQLGEIEAEVNQEILANTSVTTRLMTPEDAIAQGATALFGEKYGDEVRVVAMGRETEGRAYSMELCGGTHVARTGDIGLLALVNEGGLAAGVRRIEAVTGPDALAHLRQQESLALTAAAQLKTAPAELPSRVAALMTERQTLESQLADLRKQLALAGAGQGGSASSAAEDIGAIGFTGQVLKDIPAKELKGLADALKAKLDSGVVALISQEGGKASLVVAVTSDLLDRLSAVDLVRRGAEALGGKGGGGRPDMAQAGGAASSNPEAALNAIKSALRNSQASG
jgi:alanyl-tRNA synthetase